MATPIIVMAATFILFVSSTNQMYVCMSESAYLPGGGASVTEQLVGGHVPAADDPLEGGESKPAVGRDVPHEQGVVRGGRLVVVHLHRHLVREIFHHVRHISENVKKTFYS